MTKPTGSPAPVYRAAAEAARRPGHPGLFRYGAMIALARGSPVLAIVAASVYLPPEPFGVTAVLITSVTTASLLADSGTDAAATWLLSRAEGDDARRTMLGALIWLRVTTAGVVSAVLVLPQQQYFPDHPTQFGFIALGLLLGQVGAAYNSARRVPLRIAGRGEVARIGTEKLALMVIFIGGLLAGPPSAVAAASAYAVAVLVAPLLTLVRPRRRELATSRRSVAALVRATLPFTLSAVAAAVVWRSGVFLLAGTGRVAAAGQLSLASYPVQALTSVSVFGAPLILVNGGPHASGLRRTVLRSGLVGLAAAGLLLAAALVAGVVVPAGVVAPEVWALLCVLTAAVPLVFVNSILAAALRARVGPWPPSVAHAVSASCVLVLFAAAVLAGAVAAVAAPVIVAGEACSLILLGVLAWRRTTDRGAGRRG